MSTTPLVHSRWLVAGLVFAWVVIAFVVVLMGWLLVKGTRDYEPIEYHNPREVLTDPARAGTYIDMTVDWCNDDPRALVSSSSVFQAVGSEGVIVPRGVIVIELEEGCHVETVRVNLPETVTPGVWRLGGQDTAIGPNGEAQRVAWFTRPFTVVAAPGGN